MPNLIDKLDEIDQKLHPFLFQIQISRNVENFMKNGKRMRSIFAGFSVLAHI